jgi:hypothetical protein
VTLGSIAAVDGVFRFAGQARALADPGLSFELHLGAEAVAPRDGGCASSSQRSSVGWGGLAAIAALAVASALALAAQRWRRRRAMTKESLPRGG